MPLLVIFSHQENLERQWGVSCRPEILTSKIPLDSRRIYLII